MDTRSIEDVTPSDLAGYAQCHFFAGIGGWSYALRLAGWPDDKPAWTGSCPCQPFSAAGKGAGFADERHLWPAWFWLIQQCRPVRIFGEQVASAIDWLDLVSADLEGQGYAFGASVLGAHSVGAPHQRQRFYWVADANGGQRNGVTGSEGRKPDRQTPGRQQGNGELECNSTTHGLADTNINRCDTASRREFHGEKHNVEPCSSVGNALPARLSDGQSKEFQRARGWSEGRAIEQSGSASSFWSDAEFIKCRDGKSRPIKPSIFPLAHGISARVGKLRGAGNAIVPQVAAEFIKACQ
ncbi:MAG: DNA cytosine methyltransferase [Shewanella sp.]